MRPPGTSSLMATTIGHRPRWIGPPPPPSSIDERREDDSPSFLEGCRLVPLAMEILIGGPSSPNGPRADTDGREDATAAR